MSLFSAAAPGARLNRQDAMFPLVQPVTAARNKFLCGSKQFCQVGGIPQPLPGEPRQIMLQRHGAEPIFLLSDFIMTSPGAGQPQT